MPRQTRTTLQKQLGLKHVCLRTNVYVLRLEERLSIAKLDQLTRNDNRNDTPFKRNDLRFLRDCTQIFYIFATFHTTRYDKNRTDHDDTLKTTIGSTERQCISTERLWNDNRSSTRIFCIFVTFSVPYKWLVLWLWSRSNTCHSNHDVRMVNLDKPSLTSGL